VAVCFLFLKQLARITEIKGSLIIPIIFVLIYLGAFAEENEFKDLILVIIFGGLGWLLVRLDWPRPPFILGLVLGPLAERRLFISIDNYGFSWLLRPGVLVLFALILVGAFYPIVKERWQKRKKSQWQTSASDTTSLKEKRLTIDYWSMTFTLFLIGLFVIALWASRQYDYRTGLFPWVIGFSVLALLIVQLILGLMGREGRERDVHSIEAGGGLPIRVVNRRTAGVFGWVIGYVVAIWLFGFSIGAPLCAFVQLKFAARERWLISLILVACCWALIYGLFDLVLHVPFTEGQLFLWFQLSPIIR
jgi:hypothetical protein